MAYVKTDWVDRVVEKPNTFIVTQNPDGTITLTPANGQVIERGTPLSAENLNKIEQGLERALDAESGGHINGLIKTKSIVPIDDLSNDLGSEEKRYSDVYVGSTSKEVNGYTKLTNGMILQWGTTLVNFPNGLNCDTAITFPVKFPQAALSLNANVVYNQTKGDITYCDTILINASAYANAYGANLVGRSLVNVTDAFAIQWMAIGY